jgi:microcystin-dependent protein
MPLNKLDNFIKNTEGRILYVNPSDLDATDSIDNQGNSLARPFKTIQRAIIEAARFSYVRGNNNDLIEKTTILLFPGEHIIDNRPGWAIYDNSGVAYAVPPSGGVGTPAQSLLSLTLGSNFDLNQEDNLLYKYNSVYGGVILPRGISLVGLDLRKTKIRPKYVPNPTDPAAESSCIFRLTGTCYMWQISFFDGDETGQVYTDPVDFGDTRLSTPLFSHHKLTCFEYADGVNDVTSYGLTDLDMYYSKLSNAFNVYREIVSVDKFPENPDGFSKRTPEWEIVGAFASDPIDIDNIISGNGTTANSRVTVTTNVEHKLNVGTPIKIRGVSATTYNISTKVQEVINSTTFTYLLPDFPINLNANPSVAGATVIVETDTVTGASPYVFNCSLRSVWGMNGMFADGAKASGFKSMVVAQFTGVSLQKDDRAFVKYNPVSRTYTGVAVTPVYGSELPLGATQTDEDKVYHLDSEAIYRNGWESSHIKIANDAFIQVVSVFAIGFTKHFDARSGGDFSITNSNSNFGQFALSSTGFRQEAFAKDNKGYITSIVPPRAIDSTVEENISWLPIDVALTISAANSNRLYLFGFTDQNEPVSELVQGYRIGAKLNDTLYLRINSSIYTASILMDDLSTSSKKEYSVSGSPSGSTFDLGTIHALSTGEKVIIRSDSGDLPEGLTPETVYYVIDASSTTIKLASTFRNSQIGEFITVSGGSNLKILSRVSEKSSGEIGSPIQYDAAQNNWYVTVNSANTIYPALSSEGGVGTIGEATNLTYIKRVSDERSIDEKIYKLRVVIPKEATNAKDPESGFILQESSSTGLRNDDDFFATSITSADHDYKRNPRYISTCTYDLPSSTVTVTAEIPHDLNVGDIVVIKGVQSSTNTIGLENISYNGSFEVTSIVNDLQFRYVSVDIDGVSHSISGGSTNDTSDRGIDTLGRFERKDNQSNTYIYRNEVSSRYKEGVQDGVYYLYALNASNSVPVEFTDLKFSQSPVDLYPQLDRDNYDDNPLPAVTYAKRSPIGDVETNDLKKSITRETINKFLKAQNIGLKISTVSQTTTTATITFDRPHGFGRIISGTITPGSGYTNGTFYNVKLLIGSSNGTWRGALATVVVSGGAVTSVTITNGGSYHTAGALYFDFNAIGSGNGAARYNITANTINNNIGDVLQFTGSSITNDVYHRITAINSTTQITVARNTNDPTITTAQYAFLVGPSIQISNNGSFNSTTNTQTITCSSSHGLQVGNKVTIIDSATDSYQNLGEYLVSSVDSVTVFKIKTTADIGSEISGFVLKHGLSANNGALDFTEETFAVRNTCIYDRERFNLNTAITNTSTTTLALSTLSGTGLTTRLRFGSYILVDNEIMRVIANPNDTTVTVIRGALGTRADTHPVNSLVKKIRPIPVEFRRPSVLRASGHTFEYLGYGPGNYSTALPQVQIKTLTDRESFLSQAQERSCGIVVYNGINNSGDVFAGNTKTLASSGEVVSYDIPTPTVTGQDPSVNVAVFDEVTIKQKLLVEGGTSGTILSQFDGPVTFNNDVRVKGSLNVNGTISLSSDNPIVFEAETLLNGNITVDQNLQVNGTTTLAGLAEVDTGLVPDTNEGAYLGTSALRFSEIWAGAIGIATGTTADQDRTISSTDGDLRLNAINQIELLKDTNITGNINATGTISASRLVVPNISPVGSIMLWAADPAQLPTDWRICNGQALSRTEFSDLFTLISTNYGSGNGSTTFNIPNLNNRFSVGVGPSYGLGDIGGSANTTLTAPQIPGHTHTFTLLSAGGHDHGGNTGNNGGHNHGGNTGNNGGHDHGGNTGNNGGHDHGGNTGNNGGHNHGGNTGLDGGHSHGANGQTALNGDHSHGIQPNGSHSHSWIDRAGTDPTQNGGQSSWQGRSPANTGSAGDHNHGMNTNGNHRHDITNAPDHSHTISNVADHAHTITAVADHAHTITAVADHAHTITAVADHAHTITAVANHNHDLTINPSYGTAPGAADAHDNRPPYMALYYIIRVK